MSALSIALLSLTCISEAISMAVLVHLWRSRDGLCKMIAWTLIGLVPVLGPIAFGGFFEIPSKKPESAQNRDDLRYADWYWYMS